MSPEQLSTVILGLVGVILQLIFKYVPKVKDWYEAQSNKGLIMLAFVAATSAIYFGLGCTSLAAMLGIQITCDIAGAFAMLQALFSIASTQQLTYLFTRRTVKATHKK